MVGVGCCQQIVSRENVWKECYYLITPTQLSRAPCTLGVVLSNINKGGRFVECCSGRQCSVSVSTIIEERSSENQHLSTSSQMKDGEELGLLEENLNYQGKHGTMGTIYHLILLELFLIENFVMSKSQIWRLLPAPRPARRPDADLL